MFAYRRLAERDECDIEVILKIRIGRHELRLYESHTVPAQRLVINVHVDDCFLPIFDTLNEK